MNIKTDIDQQYSQFKEFATKEMRSALKSGVNKGASMLRTKVRQTLRQRLPAAKNTTRYGDRLTDNVKLSKMKETNDGEFFRYLMITSRQTRNSSFLLHFFEGGTQVRRTRKGYNRGMIKPLYFFADTMKQFEAQYFNEVNNGINKAIMKITNRKTR